MPTQPERQLVDLYPDCLPLAVQKTVRDRLLEDPYFAEHRVHVIIQDDGEINTLIRSKTLVISDPIILVSLSEIENNPPGAIFRFELIVLENPLANRSKANFDTALGIAWHAARLLDGDTFHFERIHCNLNEDGTFQAVAAFSY
ncbi:MAG: hypothetical protein ACI4W7_02620 [Candidatus Spyradenecus sp.]